MADWLQCLVAPRRAFGLGRARDSRGPGAQSAVADDHEWEALTAVDVGQANRGPAVRGGPHP
eukprot:7227920-Alexandrium_andersonii.AAC.1